MDEAAESADVPARRTPSRPGMAHHLLAVDVACVLLGLTLAHAARFHDAVDEPRFLGLLVCLGIAAVAFPVPAFALRLYHGRHGIGSADEFRSLALAFGTGTLVVSTVNFASASEHLLPLSVPVIGGVLAFLMAIGVRSVLVRRRESSAVPRDGAPTLVFGAGEASHQLLRSMLWDPDSAYRPVGLLDDDPAKRHVQIKGIRMLGGREDIGAVAASTRARFLVVALPSADAALLRDLTERASQAGLAVKVLPKLTELLDRNSVGIRDVRDIDIADLLGRRQIDTRIEEVAGYLVGKRVLVTGAGGSIGSELCRQIDRYGPAELMMLDRDESALHALHLTMFGEARLDLPQSVLADIRDGQALLQVFAERRPDVVFHAAALKHVNMLEQYPDEGWKTNVLGTLNVLRAAASVDVSHFINISTDKAADPANVLGHTKRLAERLTADFARRGHGRYLSVRFGNVLGSRGSVLETFAAQIARGGPVTVTHPDVTRYFMTIPEAVQLVIQAGAIGDGGEALVLDMGTPVRIADVAAQLIAIENRAIEIRFTGLRPGEKLHEELFGSGEGTGGHRPIHPLISHVPVPPLAAGDLPAGLPIWDAGRPVTGTGRPVADAGQPAPDAGRPQPPDDRDAHPDGSLETAGTTTGGRRTP